MTLRIERSEEFWTSIISHPSVNDSLGMTVDEFLNCVAHPQVTPYASENGGWLLIDLGIGLIAEFHGVFTETGRGLEAFKTGCELANIIFSKHDMAITYQTNNRCSGPPLSFGFQKENTWRSTPKGDMRLWFLTKTRWESSPAYRRTIKCPL